MTVSINGTSGLVFNDASTQNTAATGFGFKNRIINGAMVIDQRNAGAAITAPAGPFRDRWKTTNTNPTRWNALATSGGVTPPAGFTNYLGVQSAGAYTVVAADTFNFTQVIEGLNVADLGFGTANAQSVTVSFWVRSSLTGTFAGALNNAAYNRAYVFTYSIAAADTWEYKTVTVSGDTTGTWLTTNGAGLVLNFNLGNGSTRATTPGSWQAGEFFGVTGGVNLVATNGATFYITGVQLEKGSTATSFDYRPYGTELALCQRYYETYSNSSGSTQNLYLGYAIGGGNAWSMGPLKYDVPKRVTPTITISNLGGSNFSGPTPVPSVNYTVLQFTSASAGNTQVYVSNGSTWFAASAEL